MSSRHKARELALQYLFAYDFRVKYNILPEPGFPCKTEEEIASFDEETKVFASYLANGTIEHIEYIDSMIQKYSNNRAMTEIGRVNKNIIRLSIFSLLYNKETHPSIVIDEAVKLSLEFSDDVSYKFVNGVLDAFKKKEL
jgi:N utilization substance protein B